MSRRSRLIHPITLGGVRTLNMADENFVEIPQVFADELVTFPSFYIKMDLYLLSVSLWMPVQ
jgi:hypothetical protein